MEKIFCRHFRQFKEIKKIRKIFFKWGILCFKFNFIGEAVKGQNCIFKLILLKNQPQIGRRPIKGNFMFQIC